MNDKLLVALAVERFEKAELAAGKLRLQLLFEFLERDPGCHAVIFRRKLLTDTEAAGTLKRIFVDHRTEDWLDVQLHVDTLLNTHLVLL